MDSLVMFIVNVPVEYADSVRKALHDAGAGRLGAYSHCSFSYLGVGRFKPEAGAQPTIGAIGELVAIEEERIEVLCEREKVAAVIEAMKKAHPYEEPAFHFFSVEQTP